MPSLPPLASIPRPPQSQPASSRPGARPASAVVQLTSDALFAGAHEVQILHDGAVYRLKRTALGKLILTK